MIIADTVNKQIYELIRAMILERKLKPGERIDPKIIAEANHVSLMPVRNALQQLTVEGLVITQQRVGIFVRKFSREDILQIYDTRKMFEGYCMKNYFHNINRAKARALLIRQEQAHAHVGKTMRVIDHDLHSMIVNASENPFLIKQYEDMSALVRISYYNNADLEDADAAKEEHLSILRAICEGDQERALVELERHLERASRELFVDTLLDERLQA